MRWARQFGGTNTEFVSAIGVNAAGDYYVTGSFDQATTIGTTTLTALGATDAFLAKFNAAGAVQWAAAFGGAGGDTTPRGLAVSATGECYVVGDSDAPTLDFGLFQQQNPSASQGYVVR